jgi:hypothetical protein
MVSNKLDGQRNEVFGFLTRTQHPFSALQKNLKPFRAFFWLLASVLFVCLFVTG